MYNSIFCVKSKIANLYIVILSRYRSGLSIYVYILCFFFSSSSLQGSSVFYCVHRREVYRSHTNALNQGFSGTRCIACIYKRTCRYSRSRDCIEYKPGLLATQTFSVNNLWYTVKQTESLHGTCINRFTTATHFIV